MLEQGQLFGGKYRITNLLARGGMGEVYLADQGLESFSRPVVIKILIGSLATRQDLVRLFLEEAKLAAQLTHPNIVHVYDFGKEDDLFFFVMEYLRGSTLSELMRQRRRERRSFYPTFLAAVGSQVCAALHYSFTKIGADGQQLRVVHRDISPSNVLLSEEGVAKVLDFGIAKASTSPSLTQVGELKGKPSYMSPEQALGRPVDARSDLFSLGIVLWEAAAGRKLFSGGTPEELVAKVCRAPIPKLEELVPGLPGELAAIIARALERDPARRFQSAGEMGRALEGLLYNLSTESAQDAILAELRSEASPELAALERPAADPLQAWVPEWLGEGAGSGVSSAGSPVSPPPEAPDVEPRIPIDLGPGFGASQATRVKPVATSRIESAPAELEPPRADQGSLMDIELGPAAAPPVPFEPEPPPSFDFGPPVPVELPARVVAFASPARPVPDHRASEHRPLAPAPIAGAQPSPEQPPPRTRRLPLLALAGLLLVAAAGAALWAFSGGGEPAAQPVAAVEQVPATPAVEPAPKRPDPGVSPWLEAMKTVKAVIFSVPGGAAIWVDGKDTGRKTPDTIKVDTGKDHLIELRHPDYLPHSASFFAAPNQPIQMAPVLVPGAKISVDTVPPGAEVEIDGVKAFQTPDTSGPIALGKHLLFVRLAGHVAERREFDIQDPQPLSFEIDLAKGAEVAVSSVPDGAQILVEGQDSGLKTPATVVVPFGKKRSLGVKKEGFGPVTRQLTRLVDGPPRSVEVKLVSLKQVELEARASSLQRELSDWEKRASSLRKQLSGLVVKRSAREELALQGEVETAERRVVDLEAELSSTREALLSLTGP